MRTQTLKKLSAVILAVMMMIGLISGMTVSAAVIVGRDYSNGITTLGTSDITIGASQIGVWGYSGITSADAADWTSAAGFITVDAANKVITIDMTNAIDSASSKFWGKNGDKFTIGFAPTDASTATKGSDYNIMFYGLTIGVSEEIALCSDGTWDVVSKGIDAKNVTPIEALTVDATAGNKLFTKFIGYEFSLTAAGTTYKYSDTTTTLSGTTITFQTGDADLADDVQVVGTATGPMVLANQAYYFSGSEAKTGKVLSFRDAVAPATITYPITYKTAKKTTVAPTVLTFDEKIAAINAELSTITVDCSGAKKFSDLGIVVTSKSTTENLTTISINLFNNAMPSDIKVKIPKGTIIAKDFEYTLTKPDETIIVPLADGTYTFVNVKCTSNMDYVTPLTAADITLGLGNGALLDLTSLMTFNDKKYDGTNKTIFVDAVFARAGQNVGGTYFSNDGKVTTDVNTFKKLKSIIAYRGFKADGSRGVADINNRIVNTFWYDTTLVPTATTANNVWDGGKYYNFSYTLGGELINETIQPVNQYNTFKVAYDGNDYVYTVMFHGRYAELTLNAVGLGVSQLVDAKLTGAGDTFYRILTAAENTAPAGALGADEYGFAVGNLEKSEKNSEITLTNYTDKLNGDYNQSGTILSFRAPYATTVTLTSGTGVVATVLNRALATVGDTGADGLVDYFVKIDYSTLNDTKFTMKLTYADGVSRTYDVISKFVTKTADVAKFTASFGPTIVPALATAPESPVKPNDPPMSVPSTDSEASGTESSTPTSSNTSTDIGDYGNPFNAMAYIITIAASAIGGISTLVIRKRK